MMPTQYHTRRLIPLTILLLLALLPVVPGHAALVPRGSEFRVNTDTRIFQLRPAVAMDANGNFVVVWESYIQEGSYGIYAQRYGADGSPRGTEFHVNTFTSGDQLYPVVAMNATGNFIVIWQSDGQDGDGLGIYGQRYGADGSPHGTEFLVNSFTTGVQQYPAVAMDADGNFVVSWESNGQDGLYDVYARRYGADGSPRGTEVQVNAYKNKYRYDVSSKVAMEDNGDFVISWLSYGFHGLEGQVYARHYESDGTPRGAEFLVNTATTASNPWSPSVAMDADGDFVISWERGDLNKTDVDIYAQRYGVDDSPRGDTFQVNTFTAGVQTLPTVAMDTDGDFVISWQSNGQDDFAGGIYAQRYGANGNPRSAEFPVSSYLRVAQGYPTVAMDANGDFVISWESSGQDGSAEGIYAQRFAQAPDISLGAAIVQPVVILENSTMSVPFRVSSTRTAAEKLVVSATTISNTELLPTSGLTIGGSGASRTLTMIPTKTNGLAKPNSYGSAVVRITASDPSNNTSTNIDLPISVQASPWLVMLYLAGDDYGSLSSGVDDILTELRQMPYNPAMRLVVLADQKGGGNTRAFVRDPSGLTQITPKDDTTLSILSGELDTGSRDTLKRYISWATTTFPDYQHTFLAVVDHGGGWAPDFTRGGAQPSAGRKVKSGGWRGMSMDLNEGGGTSLSTYDTGKALRDGLGSSEKIDVLFFDACLMGMTESAYEVRDKANYLIAAQNLLFQEEDLRTYSAYLDPDILTPETTPELLATKVVSTYNTIDSYNGRVRQAANPFSIAAIDLTKLDDLAQQVNSLAQALLSAYPNTDGIALYHALLPAYTQAQKFDYDSDEKIEQETDGYVDLGHLAQLLHDDLSLPASVRTSAGYVMSAVTAAVVAKQTVSGVYQSDVADQQIWDLDHSSGLSIYAPLGEEDWRPTRILTASVQLPAGCEAASESQLTYYVQDTQLQFTSTGAPGLPWGTLLTRIRPNVPRIHASCLDPEDETDGKVVDTSPFHSPDRVALYHQVLLPFIKH